MDTCLNELNKNNDKVDKNIGYLGETGEVFKFVQNVNKAK